MHGYLHTLIVLILVIQQELLWLEISLLIQIIQIQFHWVVEVAGIDIEQHIFNPMEGIYLYN